MTPPPPHSPGVSYRGDHSCRPGNCEQDREHGAGVCRDVQGGRSGRPCRALVLQALSAHAPPPSFLTLAPQAINQSYEMSLQQGLIAESRLFWSTFATKDQKVGFAYGVVVLFGFGGLGSSA